MAGPSALIGASNFFELAVAAAIALSGFQSGAALATVSGVLVEVPVMLSVVHIVRRSRGWYEAGAARHAAPGTRHPARKADGMDASFTSGDTLPARRPGLLAPPDPARLEPGVRADHLPRILLRVLGAETRTFDPRDPPVANSTGPDHPKVQELRALLLWMQPGGPRGGDGRVQEPDRLAAAGDGRRAADAGAHAGRHAGVRRLAVLRREHFAPAGPLMRMVAISNQSSVPRAYGQFDDAGRMRPGPLYGRVVDVTEELVRFTWLLRDRAGTLVDRYSELAVEAITSGWERITDEADFPEAIPRAWFHTWRITCPRCGERVSPARSAASAGILPDLFPDLFPDLWAEALAGERLVNTAFHHQMTALALPIPVMRPLRLLMIWTGSEQVPAKGRRSRDGWTLDAVVSGLDAALARHGIAVPRTTLINVPLPVRTALLAGVALASEDPAPAIQAMWATTVGMHRAHFRYVLTDTPDGHRFPPWLRRSFWNAGRSLPASSCRSAEAFLPFHKRCRPCCPGGAWQGTRHPGAGRPEQSTPARRQDGGGGSARMTTASRFVSCRRVGTDKQSRSGLSLECSPAVAAYVASAHGLIA